MEKKTKSFLGGAAVLAIAGLLVKIIGAFYRIPLTNIVGVEGMDYYETVYPWYSWLLVISSAGLPTAISKMVSERVTVGDYKAAKRVFSTALKLLLGIGIVTTLIMLFGANLISSFSYPADETEIIAKQAMSFRALSPALLFVSVMCAYRGYLQGLQHMIGTAVSQVIEQIGKLAIGFTLALLLLKKGPEYAITGALIGVSVSELLALAAIWFIYKRKSSALNASLPKNASSPFKGSITKTLLSIAIPITIGASIMPVTGIIDSVLIKRTLVDIGFSLETARTAYSLLRSNVTTIINMPAVLTMALAMSLVPAISSSMAKKDYKSVRAASVTGMKFALLIGAPCSVGLFVLAKPILSLLYTGLTGAQLELAASLMRTSAIGVLFLSLVQAMTGTIQGMGRPNVPVVNLIFGGILKVAAMFILIPLEDVNIQGAAISTVICYAAAGIMDTVYVLRKTGVRLNVWDALLKPLLASLIMGVCVHLVYGLVKDHGSLATLLSIAVGGGVYLVMIFVLKMLSPTDLEFMPGGRKIKKLMYR